MGSKRTAVRRTTDPVSLWSGGSSTSDGTAIAQIRDSLRRGKLVAIIGTGSSGALTNGSAPALSWCGLVKDGFAYALKKGLITGPQATAWEPQLGSSDLDDLLAAAEFVGRKLGAPDGDLYARWLRVAFEHVRVTNSEMADAIRSLADANVPLCTTNYDCLLESVTELPTINFSDTMKVTSWMRRETSAVGLRYRCLREISCRTYQEARRRRSRASPPSPKSPIVDGSGTTLRLKGNATRVIIVIPIPSPPSV